MEKGTSLIMEKDTSLPMEKGISLPTEKSTDHYLLIIDCFVRIISFKIIFFL